MCLGWDYYTRLSRNVTRTANIYCYNLVTFNFQTYSDASNNDRGDLVINFNQSEQRSLGERPITGFKNTLPFATDRKRNINFTSKCSMKCLFHDADKRQDVKKHANFKAKIGEKQYTYCERNKTSLDFNYVKPCFDLFQFSYNFMTKGFSNLNRFFTTLRQVHQTIYGVNIWGYFDCTQIQG